MKEQFLTKEQSKEMRILGFNEPYLAFYNGKYLDFSVWDWECPIGEKRRDIGECTIAPTYQQSFDFIREKFGYNYFIKAFGKDTYTFFIEKWKWKYYENDFKLPYEEARARCLDKLIEIINNDK